MILAVPRGKAADWKLLLGILTLLTAIRLAVASSVPLSPDEAYYWVWSRDLQPGYLDHPPMVALWIWIGTALAGNTALGVRLLAPISALIGSLAIYKAGEDLLPFRRAGFVACLLLNATLVLGVGSVIMTPDTPLMLFWCLCIAAFGRWEQTGNGRWWWAAGACVGLAMASKYTGAFLPISIVCIMLLHNSWRREWFKKDPYIAVFIAFLLFSPVLYWNWTHHWASFGKQGSRVGDFHPTNALRFVVELLIGQFGLATPMIFVACCGGLLWAWRRRAQPTPALLASLIILPGLVFLEHALGDRVQANWPCILYPAACLAAAGRGKVNASAWRGAVLLGFALTALVYVQAVFAPFPLDKRLDPSLAQLGGWKDWAAQVDQARAAQGADFITSDNYGMASMLRWYLPDRRIVATGRRWALFSYPSSPIGQSGILVTEAGARMPQAWREFERIGTIRRMRGAALAGRYDLYHIHGNPSETAALLAFGR